MKPFVSVIIPTYNRLELLKKTVASVRSQSFRDFEIIVINDGSSDGTAEWLAQQHDIVGINRRNSGIASSRNKGASVSKGQWLAFLDHDDIWDPEKLQTQVDFWTGQSSSRNGGCKTCQAGNENRSNRSMEMDTGRSIC